MNAPPRRCTQPGCSALVRGRSSRCEQHDYDAKRPSPARRGYDKGWRAHRKHYLAMHPTCAKCGAKATQVDHIVPLRRGGTHAESNLQSLCESCHSTKTATEDGGFGRASGNG